MSNASTQCFQAMLPLRPCPQIIPLTESAKVVPGSQRYLELDPVPVAACAVLHAHLVLPFEGNRVR